MSDSLRALIVAVVVIVVGVLIVTVEPVAEYPTTPDTVAPVGHDTLDWVQVAER